MINKIVQTMADLMAGIKDGSVVLLGGFGAVGQPNALIDGLIEQGATNLTVACNNAGVGHTGLAAIDGAGTGQQDHLLVSAQLRSRGVRDALPRRARSSWRSCRRGRWRNACGPPGPGCRRSSPRPGSAPRWRWARNTGRSTGAPTSWSGAEGRCRAGGSVGGGSLGQPDLQAGRPELQSDLSRWRRS